ncbi:hypothetical protein CHUAL_012443 [Chamberlinius hualienensis]
MLELKWIILILIWTSSIKAQYDLLDSDDDVRCTPEFADSCFSDVEDDLKTIFTKGPNTFILQDLCSAWNDSLDCTSDIIDTECDEKDGRIKFDHWHSALSKTWQFVCYENPQILKDVFSSAQCFNVSAFLYCIETTSGVNSSQSLLSTDLDVNECRYLKKVIDKCGEYVTYGSCALEILKPISTIVDYFFNAGDCSKPIIKPVSNSNRINYNIIYFIMTISLTAITL